MKSLFDSYVNKPMSKMTAHEKITSIWHNIVFQKQIRKRIIANGKEHNEIVFLVENDPTSWVCKRKLIKRFGKY